MRMFVMFLHCSWYKIVSGTCLALMNADYVVQLETFMLQMYVLGMWCLLYYYVPILRFLFGLLSGCLM